MKKKKEDKKTEIAEDCTDCILFKDYNEMIDDYFHLLKTLERLNLRNYILNNMRKETGRTIIWR